MMIVSQKMSQDTRNQATTRAAPVAQWIERPPPNYPLSDMGIPITALYAGFLNSAR